jgi:hypothetical protein
LDTRFKVINASFDMMDFQLKGSIALPRTKY